MNEEGRSADRPDKATELEMSNDGFGMTNWPNFEIGTSAFALQSELPKIDEEFEAVTEVLGTTGGSDDDGPTCR
jgi:hypothetical protein